MFTFKILFGPAGSGKTTKLRQEVLSVGGTLLLMSEINELSVQEISNHKLIGVDEVTVKEDFEMLKKLSSSVNVVLATQLSQQEIESFCLGKDLTFHSCSVRL